MVPNLIFEYENGESSYELLKPTVFLFETGNK